MTMYFTYAIDPDVYYDLEGLSGTIQMNMPIAISNSESETLYFKVEIIDPPTGYTLYTQNLGSLAAGASGFFVWNFQRDTPTLSSDELDEALTIRLTAYTDAGYSVVYGYVNAASTIHFFDSYGVSWTSLYHDTFDDGGVDGWYADTALADPAYPYGAGEDRVLGGSTTHFLSAPYSLAIIDIGSSGSLWSISKTFTVGAYTRARLVLHVYLQFGWTVSIKIGSTVVMPGAIGNLLPSGKWLRLVFTLPVGVASKVTLSFPYNATWLDEVRVIAK